jgi:spectinomycin phosphotransferase
MLVDPGLHHETILACVRDAYGLPMVELAFLPFGADRNTSVYRAVAESGTHCSLKVRLGAFDETSVLLPKFLRDQRVAQIIAPSKARRAARGPAWTPAG